MSDSENTPIEPNPAQDDAPVEPSEEVSADLASPLADETTPPEASAEDERIPVPDDGLGEWPTHGGPLGCLVGLMFGFLLAGFLGSTLISFVHFSKAGAGGWYIFSAVVVMLVFSILFANIGWRIGKRIYRHYEPSPRQLRYEERVRQMEQERQNQLPEPQA